MMRVGRWTLIVTVIGFVLVGLLGAGASNALRAEPTAVGVANVERIFNALNERTAVEAQIRSRREQLEREEQQKERRIQQLQQDLQILNSSEPAYRQTERELRQALREYEVWAKMEQQDLAFEQGLQTERLYRKILDTVERIAQDNGYDLVLFQEGEPNFRYEHSQELAAQIRMRKLLYASNGIDISDQVVQRMNNEFESR